MSRTNKPLGRKDEIVVQEVDGEVLIYDLKRDKAFCLNKTSAIVWQACDGKRTVAEIGGYLAERLGTKTDDDILWLALDQLSKEKLIEPATDFSEKFSGLSRRQVIRKIGLGSMIALPVVASLIAPTAAHANSACMTVLGGCICNFSSGTMTYPVGADCSAMTLMACVDMNCRCVQTAGPLLTPDNCVP